MRADGADLALFEVEVVDADDHRCPTAMNMIDFKLEGAAEWRGGIAEGRDDNYILATSLPVECGVNRVLLRATTQPGKFRLTARADGLSPATFELESRSVSVVAGLSADKPWEGLPSYLELGPTPAGPSYSPSRRPLEIASTSAGSNAEDAALSLDDNELTKWSIGSARGNAWITYHLAEAQLLVEVCMIVESWRTASYPIRVLVDGRSVWAGNTPRSLGYVTISFEPERGNSVTVALEGVTSVHDEFGQIVEVTGVVDLSSSTRGRRLAIV
jgi:hypothetical protein